MVLVRFTCGNGELLEHVEIHGHAGFLTGNTADTGYADPACAAVSTLAKAYALTITEHSGHRVYGSVDQPGEFILGIDATDNRAHACAAGRMLMHGISEAAAAFPGTIRIEYTQQ